MRGTRTEKLGVLLAAALAIALVGAPSAPALTFTVTSTADLVDTLADDNVCDADGVPGPPTVCTLRAAIEESNDEAVPVADTIDFAPAIANDMNAANRTFNISLALPDITEQLTIDGCAQANSQAQPCVGIRAPSTAVGIIGTIAANNVTIRDVAFSRTLAALGLGDGQTGLTLEGNWFGLMVDGTSDAVTIGVTVAGDNSTIGGTDSGEGNVFANAGTGLVIHGHNNQVQGNLFGVKANGTTAAANTTALEVRGANMVEPATGNTIGGTQPVPGSCTGPCNVIANSTGSGILLQSGNLIADGTTISGNFIGLNQSGGLAGNANGVQNLNATETTVGGAAAGERNYVSGGANGILAAAQGPPGLEIRNNFIGIAPAGNATLGPPTSTGILANSDTSSAATISGNRIAVAPAGFTTAMSVSDYHPVPPPAIPTTANITNNVIGLGTGNQDLGGGSIGLRATGLDQATISGNTFTNSSFAGLTLEDADDNLVTVNRFGTDETGAGDHWGVSGQGIVVDQGLAASTGNTIGGNTAASENVLSNIPGSPIAIRSGANDDNTIGRNRGSNNTGVFIDLGQDGAGNNDPSAPNNGIDAPTITTATDDAVRGTAVPNSIVLLFRTPDAGNPTDVSSFLRQTTASATGVWQATPGLTPVGARVTALQTDASGDSSELSASRAAVPDPPETTITRGPRRVIRSRRKSRRVRFTFVSSEPGEGGFQCQIDRNEFGLCKSPFSFKIRRGRHTFRVRAYDAASNPDPTLAVRTFRLKRKRRR